MLTLTSTAFQSGRPIPQRFTGEGPDVSPPLAWSDPPAQTKELALIVDDPDAPTSEPWVHWLLYKIPPETRTLPESIRKFPTLSSPIHALQGKNSFGASGYNGPMPPKGHGTHHYHFRLYALDQPLIILPDSSRAVLENAIKSHILATGELIGTYERK